jgi:hypothetical protein
MDGTGAEEVCKEQCVAPDTYDMLASGSKRHGKARTLRGKDHKAHERSRFLHLQEDKQMHPLVVALLKQSFDPVKPLVSAP